jgi:hypothetical protein
MTESLSQIVYVLTNPAMLGLVKIGKTTQLEVEDRMKQFFGACMQCTKLNAIT